MRKKHTQLLLTVLFFMCSARALAYPSEEIVATSGPPFNFNVTSSLSGFLLLDDTRLALSFGERLRLIDTRSFSEETSQPPALSADDDTDGTLMGIAFDSPTNVILASQDDGDLLFFDLDTMTIDPESLTLAAGKELGPLAVDTTRALAYVSNNAERKLHKVSTTTRTLEGSITLTIGTNTSFKVTDAFYNSEKSEFYFTTDAGGVFVVESGATAATLIGVDTATGVDLVAVAATPNGASVYCVDATTPAIVKIDGTSHAVLKSGSTLKLTANGKPTDIVITDVVRPISGTTAIYAFVAGDDGISVMNTGNDEIFDLGNPDDADIDDEPIPVSVVPKLLAASSTTDGYIYLGNSTGSVGLLSANPWITIGSLTYSAGGSSLGVGGSATLTFQSDETGTYEVRVGGTQTATGSLLTTDAGSTSTGTVTTANENIALTFSYADNQAVLSEGTNRLFVFVTDGTSDRGRRSTNLTVDTPPPNVTVEGTSFGNGRIYVTVTRLTASDIDRYNVYVSPTAADVLTATTVSGTITQASSGGNVTGSVSGLNNGTTYFIAVEAQDNAGNVSAARTTTLSNGTALTAMPEVTGGPAGLSGETGGCSLTQGTHGGLGASIFLLGFFVLIALRCKQARRRSFKIYFFTFVCACFLPLSVDAEKKESPQLGSFELKSGLWMPASGAVDSFYGTCCNVITQIEGGLLFQRRYGVEVGAGFFTGGGTARGIGSGTTSQDSFRLTFFPFETNLVWRADYFSWRWLVPFVKGGGNTVYYRETTAGDPLQGVKFGVQGSGGFQIRLTEMNDSMQLLDADSGINDLFVILEAEYRWIDSFGKNGLDLSGPLYSVGLLLEF